MSLSARIVDATDDASGIDSAPPTSSAWKLDAMAIGALVLGAILAFALHKGIV